jgi:hypothetical protein
MKHLSFFLQQPVFGSLPSGFEQSGVFLDPHRVMVKNILWISRNGNGTCVPAVHFICIYMSRSKQSYRTHSFARSFSSHHYHMRTYIYTWSDGLAATINAALMSKLFTFRSLLLWSCAVNWGILTWQEEVTKDTSCLFHSVYIHIYVVISIR